MAATALNHPMEDKVSRSSMDSLSVADEYVVVTPSEEKAGSTNGALAAQQQEVTSVSSSGSGSDTGLRIAGNGNMDQLKHNLEEVLEEHLGGIAKTTRMVPPSIKLNLVSSGVGHQVDGPGNDDLGSPQSPQEKIDDIGDMVMSGHVDSASPKDEDSQEDPWVPRSSKSSNGHVCCIATTL